MDVLRRNVICLGRPFASLSALPGAICTQCQSGVSLEGSSSGGIRPGWVKATGRNLSTSTPYLYSSFQYGRTSKLLRPSYIRGATRRIPATNEYTPNPGDRNRTRDRETRIFRGPEPGPPGTRVPGQHMVPFTVIKRTQYVDDRAYFDCIWRRELQAPSATSLCILTQDPPSALDEHCYWKFFIVGESTLNKLCHVVARYPGGRRMHVCNVLQFKRCDCWT